MANWYVSSVKFAAIAQWAASTAYSLGDYRRRLTGETNTTQRVFKCTTAGTSDASEPTWNVGNNGTTNDGTVVWTQVGGQEAEQATGNWKAAMGSIGSMLAVTAVVAGDIIYVAHDHAESWATGTILSANVMAICVNSAGATLPPTSADLATTGSLEVTGTNTLTFSSNFSAIGLKFKSGTGSSGAASGINFNFTSYFENCEFELASTSVSATIGIGLISTGNGYIEWNNCKAVFQNSSQKIDNAFSEFLWRDTPSPLGATIPTTLLNGASTNGARSVYTLRNLDLSAFSGNIATISNQGSVTVENCKLHASTTLGGSSGVSGDRAQYRFHNCDTGTTGNVGFNVTEKTQWIGLITDPLVYRNGGASDGINSYSLRVSPVSNAERINHRGRTLTRLAKRYNLTGVSRIFKVEGLIHATSLPTRSKLFCDFYVLQSATSPVASKISTQADFLDTSAPDSSSADWSAGLTARPNSTLVAQGNFYKVASNPGRIFLVTTSGTTAASEPAGYASAVDGGTVSDGTAVMKALVRVKFEVTATPARAGVVFAKLYLMAPVNTIFWFDPKIEVA